MNYFCVSFLNKKCPNDPKRFIRQDHCTSDGEIADKLHDTFGFRTDYEIVSQRDIKKILTATRT